MFPAAPGALDTNQTPLRHNHCFPLPGGRGTHQQGGSRWQHHGAWQMTARSAGEVLQTPAQLELAGTWPFCCSNASSHQRRKKNCGWLNERGGKGHLVGFPHLFGGILHLKGKKKAEKIKPHWSYKVRQEYPLPKNHKKVFFLLLYRTKPCPDPDSCSGSSTPLTNALLKCKTSNTSCYHSSPVAVFFQIPWETSEEVLVP